MSRGLPLFAPLTPVSSALLRSRRSVPFSASSCAMRRCSCASRDQPCARSTRQRPRSVTLTAQRRAHNAAQQPRTRAVHSAAGRDAPARRRGAARGAGHLARSQLRLPPRLPDMWRLRRRVRDRHPHTTGRRAGPRAAQAHSASGRAVFFRSCHRGATADSAASAERHPPALLPAMEAAAAPAAARERPAADAEDEAAAKRRRVAVHALLSSLAR